jgi:hemerythrin
MLDYTVEHFSDEEKFMADHSYPGLAFQKQQHNEFKKAIYELIADFEEEGATKEIANHIRDFLFIWLKIHIMEVDLELGQFVNENT